MYGENTITPLDAQREIVRAIKTLYLKLIMAALMGNPIYMRRGDRTVYIHA